MKSKKKVSIFWDGMPVCGLLVEKINIDHKLDLYSTPCKTKLDRNIFEKNGIKIISIKNRWLLLFHILKIRRSDIFIQTGWHIENLIIALLLLLISKTKIYITVDNIYHGSTKQNIAKYMNLGKLIDLFTNGYFVPGRMSYKFLKKIGVNKRIYFRSYGASTKIFHKINEIELRKNQFLYVGSLSARKSTELLISAYKNYRKNGGIWGLLLVGDNLNGFNLSIDEKLVNHINFTQPEELNIIMNNSKCLILPSELDHWGTVICEAAATGMILIGSVSAGATVDLIDEGVNGYSIEPSLADIESKLFLVEKSSKQWMSTASIISMKKARKFNEDSYKRSIQKMLN